ncbi:MAG: hypothetical protein L6R39_007758, partial [Caloplaca ligustica]
IISHAHDWRGGGTRLDLEMRTRHARYTEALRNPDILADEPTFLLHRKSLTVDKEAVLQGLAGQEVLVIVTVGDKEKIAWLLLLCVVLSPVLGIVVGHFAHRAE